MSEFIAISLGSSYSVIALLPKNDAPPQIIANQDGDHLIPSVVTFPRQEFQVTPEDEHILTATQAQQAWPSNMQRVVTGIFKDLLTNSSLIDRATVEKHLQSSSHPQARWMEGKFHIETEEDVVELTPKQIAALYLGRLRESAAGYLGNQVDGVSLTYTPLSSHTLKQPHPLFDISKEAGFEKVLLISDPAAAVLAYDVLAPTNDPRQNLMVLSIGSIMTSVYIISNNNGIYTLQDQHHEYGLGGRDLDVLLRDHFATEFARKYKIPDIVEIGKRGLIKLLLAAEKTKITLSQPGSQQAHCMVDSLWEGIDMRSSVNRLRWESMTDAWERKILQVVQRALPDSKLDQVLLVGGSTKIPKLQNSLENFFKSTELHKDTIIRSDLDPSTVLAQGAAIHVHNLKSKTLDFPTEYTHWLENDNVIQTLHTSKPIALNGQIIVPAGSPLPLRKTINVSNSEANQTEVFLELTQGEEKLAQFVLGDLTAKGVGEAKVDVIISVDKNQVVSVVAKEQGVDNMTRFKIQPAK